MIRTAIIGCGKIADEHAEILREMPECNIVGVCDREPMMAEQLSERFQVPSTHISAGDLLEATRPDIVHITTPPQSHFELAKLCLEAGCHVYVEKPFTLNAIEARELIALAQAVNREITVGHNYQFSPAVRRMREMIAEGYLGGPPTHMESYYSYDLSGSSYAKAFLGEQHHWVRALPGGLLQNIINHGICRIVEFLECDDPLVVVHGFSSQSIVEMGGEGIVDELRTIISDRERTTAYFTFSSQMRPPLHLFRIFGPQNALFLDHNHQSVVAVKGTRYKSYLDTVVPSASLSLQYAANLLRNVSLFARNRFHMNAGLRYLISAFYSAVEGVGCRPIPYRDILVTTTIMDSIFSQLSHRGESGDM